MPDGIFMNVAKTSEIGSLTRYEGIPVLIPDAAPRRFIETIDGVSKQLTIAIQNSNYQHM